MKDALFLLDGYGLIFRSYFAFIRNPLRNPEGRNTSAIFGFFRSLFSILNEHSPGYFVVALDSTTPTHRHKAYADYKATRDRSPDELKEQIPIIEEILTVLGVPTLRVDGYEADDIIATLAETSRKTGRECFIVSSDKDLLQLVDGPVKVLRPADGSYREMDRDGVFEAWGVYPEQILDYLSLVGDSSDNVPGVKGIGAKTAVSLLNEYGTLDGIFDHLDDISSSSQREKLSEGRESAGLSRNLITLEKAVPVPADFETFRLGPLDGKAAAPYFIREGIKSIAKDLLGGDDAAVDAAGKAAAPSGKGGKAAAASGAGAAVSVDPSSGLPDTELDHEAVRMSREARGVDASLSREGTYETVTTLKALDTWISRIKKAKWFAFDSETSGIDPMTAHPVGFSLSVRSGEACYIPLLGPEGVVLAEKDVLPRFRELFGDPGLHLIGQNIKYDYKVMKRWGVTMGNIAFDTMIAAWLLDTTANIYNMDRLAEDFLGYRTLHYEEVIREAVPAADVGSGENGKSGSSRESAQSRGSGGKGIQLTFDRVPLDRATRYAAEDADITFRLYEVFSAELDSRKLRKLFDELEMPLVRVLGDMEIEGIRLDSDRLVKYSSELAGKLVRTERKIYDLCGKEFNIASTKQLQEVLFQERKLRPGKKTKTGYSTDTSVLEELAREDPVPALVLEHRLLSKLKSTYVDALPTMVNAETGRIHSDFHQTGTATGRISSKDPNLQNIPIRDEEGRRIREAFVPDPWKQFVSADYAQIELVILAHLSGDPALCEAFRTGEDVHRRTGALIFGVDPDQVTDEQRRAAKTINFGVMYGMSAFRLSRELNIPRADADRFIEAYFRTYSRIKGLIDEVVAQAEKTGYVKTLMGRERPVPAIRSRNRVEKAGAERIAVNTPIQGTGADIIKLAMLHIDKRLATEKLASRLVLQVHDELILECPDKEVARVKKLLEEEMVSVVKLSVPLRVSVESGTSWGELH